MSKVEVKKAVKLSEKERGLMLAYPHIARFQKCYEWTRQFDPVDAEEGKPTYRKLENGSISDVAFPMILTVTDVTRMKLWFDNRQDYKEIDEEISEMLTEALK